MCCNESFGSKGASIGIWICGLLASMIIGCGSASLLTGDEALGMLCGPLVFTCVRLWFTNSRKKCE